MGLELNSWIGMALIVESRKTVTRTNKRRASSLQELELDG